MRNMPQRGFSVVKHIPHFLSGFIQISHPFMGRPPESGLRSGSGGQGLMGGSLCVLGCLTRNEEYVSQQKNLLGEYSSFLIRVCNKCPSFEDAHPRLGDRRALEKVVHRYFAFCAGLADKK